MYKIVEKKNKITLMNDIKYLLDNGYKLCGGVSVYVSPYSKETVYVQALIKESEQ